MVTNSGKRKYTKKVMRGGEEKYILFDLDQKGNMIMGYQISINGSTMIRLIDGTEAIFNDLYSNVAYADGSKSKCYLLDLGNGLTPFQLINKGGIVYQYNANYVDIKKKVFLLSQTTQIPGWVLNTHTGFPGSR